MDMEFSYARDGLEHLHAGATKPCGNQAAGEKYRRDPGRPRLQWPGRDFDNVA